MAHVRLQMSGNHLSDKGESTQPATSEPTPRLLGRLNTRENRWALILFLIIILLVILTAGQSPAWIYQGF